MKSELLQTDGTLAMIEAVVDMNSTAVSKKGLGTHRLLNALFRKVSCIAGELSLMQQAAMATTPPVDYFQWVWSTMGAAFVAGMVAGMWLVLRFKVEKQKAEHQECTQEPDGHIYVTKHGEVYHTNPSCSALVTRKIDGPAVKRQVTALPRCRLKLCQPLSE